MNEDGNNSLMKYLGKLSLIAAISIGLVGALIFITVYGVMRAPDAGYTDQAVGVLLTLAAAVGGAIVAMLKGGNGAGGGGG